MSESSRFKVGDRVVVINNSHYGNKPRRIVGIRNHIFNTSIRVYELYGVRCHWDKTRYIGFREEELIPEEIWNSPLYKALKED